MRSRHWYISRPPKRVEPGGDGSRGGRCAQSIFPGETGFRTLPGISTNGARREAHPQRLTVRGPVHIPLTPKCTCAQQPAEKNLQ